MLRRRCLSALTVFAAMQMTAPRLWAAAETAGMKESLRETEPYDVVVVGTGMAGHCAAISAKQNGARRVLMIDKAPVVGGHSALASGSIAFVDEKRQAAQHIEDSVEKFLEDAVTVGGVVDEGMVRFLAEKSADGVKWLESLGVRFEPRIFRAYGGLHPRSLTAYGNMGARRYIFQLHQKSRENGVQTRLLTRAVGLSRTEQGDFDLELQDERNDSRYHIRARSVVLATGGFGANLALRLRYNPGLDHEIPTTANPHGLLQDTATGDGLILAKELGAAWVNMDSIVLLSYWGGRMLDYIGAEIYVDGEGRRFVDETAPTSRIAEAIARLPSRSMYVITDAKSVKGVNVGAKITAGSIHRSASIKEMARGMNVPASELERTIENYNKHAEANVPDEFGRSVYAQSIDTPPFYWGMERLMIHTTLGGLRVDTTARVKRDDGSVIKGLYAAGEVAGGIWGRDRLGGTGLLQCLVLGREAGLSASRRRQAK